MKTLLINSGSKLRQIPLRQGVILPFVLQIFAVVGLVGYLSYRSGQQAVTNLANQLLEEIGDRVAENLDSYFTLIESVNQNNATLLQQNLLDIYDLSRIQNYFTQQNRIFPAVSTIALANEEGDFLSVEQLRQDTLVIRKLDASLDPRFYRYFANEQGENLKLQEIRTDYNPHNDPPGNPWYEATRKARQGNWSLVVSLSKGKNQPEIHVAHMLPLYDTNQQFQGVSIVTGALIETGQFLANLNVGKNGQVFLIEPNGLLIATSTKEVPFEPQPRSKLSENVNVKHRRLSATQSQNEITRYTTNYLFKNKHLLINTSQHQTFEFQLNSARYLGQVISLPGELNWLMVTVVPESDFMAEISANIQTTIILCLLALLVAIILGIFTARWITQPILKLNQAAKNLREGQWEQETELEIDRQDELGELAQSFKGMATQLQASFATLEQRVADRTAELTESNQQLAVAKEKAEVANQAKSTFIANMSHELRTPLNAILGFSELLTRSPNLTPDHRDSIRLINQSGEHLLTLINNVLELSKIEAGRITLNPQNFDLWNLLNETVDMFHWRAESKDLQLLFEREADVPRYLYTDLVKLRQVLINLLNNAIKFTQEGGVTLRVGIANSQWLIANGKEQTISNEQLAIQRYAHENSNQQLAISFEVEDTGSGIAESELGQLFQAFSQTQIGKNAQEGTGLGLAISRRFVQLMEGEITVKSQVGVGSIFTFEIQTLLGNATMVAPQKPTSKILALAPNQPSYKLLVVDDKATNRQLLIKLLSPLGFQLQEAVNGKEAIAIWQEWEPQLIFMDMRMPVMDGYEATKQIKSTTRGQATAVIAITASVLEQQKKVVLLAGCDDFIRKPFRQTDIFETINRHLGVRYLYEEDNSNIYHREKATSAEQIAAILTPANLAVLPQDLLHNLEAAAIRSKRTQVNSLIEEVRTLNCPLADALATLANGFKYHIIATLLHQAAQRYEQ